MQKAVLFFVRKKAFENHFVDEKVNILNETLLNISWIYIRNKKVKLNDKITRYLRERTKLTKYYYKNGQRKEDQEKLEAKAAYCTEQILKAKNDCILSVTNKLNDPNTAPKTYWSILQLVSAIFYQIVIFSPNHSPSKTMKSVIYFI